MGLACRFLTSKLAETGLVQAIHVGRHAEGETPPANDKNSTLSALLYCFVAETCVLLCAGSSLSIRTVDTQLCWLY